MANNPLTLSRRHVLGDLYAQCDAVTEVPIFWTDPAGPPIGYVSDTDGKYSDSLTFHMGDEFCRKLAGGQLLCQFNYEHTSDADVRSSKKSRRLRLTSFVLTSPALHVNPVTKQLELRSKQIA